MLESRTQENVEFENFFCFVRKAALKEGAVYFIDCGEGKEIYQEGIEGEDLSGWLIPKRFVDDFAKDYAQGKEDDTYRWDQYYRFAEWELDDNNSIQIKFINYGIYFD